ncbi:hypothetical protein LTR36_008289 [Oleoguttula mirabilis]|uniref:non-specific serine/threonine protein kinase n=1 Tax=Oleoguttula mirabilis TaxID=1507867 RepID=A0AAV9J7S0_9PEZI|nr:hypothetical protein LTR36_008289 [Oleoguttula mirabilis]
MSRPLTDSDPGVHRSVKRSQADLDTSTSSSSSPQPPVKYPKHSASPSAQFSEAGAEAILTSWYDTCRSQNLDPIDSDNQVQGLSLLLGLSPAKIGQWCGKHALAPLIQASPGTAALGARSLQGEGRDDRRRRLAETHAANSRFKTCASNVPVPAKGGKLKCTWGCSFSHPRRYEWERHEELRQPQNFWVCDICVDTKEDRCVFISQRQDKFFDHAKTSHSHGDRNRLAARSKVDYYAGFDQTCTFRSGFSSDMCGHVFTGSWKERNDHWITHFGEDIDDESFGGPPGDGAHYEHPGPDLGGVGPLQGPSTGSKQASKSSSSNSGSTQCASTANGLSMLSTSGLIKELDTPLHNLYPLILIDVEHRRFVKPIQRPKYLAFSYTWAYGEPTMSIGFSADLSREDTPISQLGPLGLPFQKAMTLTAEMGYAYVWIDALCEPYADLARRDKVFEGATMIIVIACCPRFDDLVWHFTCHFCDLPTVRSWMEHRIELHHIQTLGHGAYGIVDEVQLLPARQNYARKILFRTTVRDRHGNGQSHEIEVMQKLNQLDHPHIARFVAAYHDTKALNILMKPVAECDLRQYLAEPSKWPRKRTEVQRWFMSLASALECMHRASCKHKDIKPANILINGDEVFLTDFGTAIDFSTHSSGSSGSALMTPKYCAPEVARHTTRGRSADIYSLGCVFVEMITLDLGSNLAELAAFTKLCANDRLRRDTYHENEQSVQLWLRQLTSRKPSVYQRTVLHLCGEMLAPTPNTRPSAEAVVKRLCPSTDCAGQTKDLQCHCCLRRDAMNRARSLNILVGYRPCLPDASTLSAGRKPSSALRARRWKTTDARSCRAHGESMTSEPTGQMAHRMRFMAGGRLCLSSLTHIPPHDTPKVGIDSITAGFHGIQSRLSWLTDGASALLSSATAAWLSPDVSCFATVFTSGSSPFWDLLKSRETVLGLSIMVFTESGDCELALLQNGGDTIFMTLEQRMTLSWHTKAVVHVWPGGASVSLSGIQKHEHSRSGGYMPARSLRKNRNAGSAASITILAAQDTSSGNRKMAQRVSNVWCSSMWPLEDMLASATQGKFPIDSMIILR